MASSDPDFVVLHTLRCIGFSGDDRIAAASGLGPHETSVRLRTLQDRGLVEYTSGHFGGWGLSDLGRSSGDRILRAELEAAGALDHVTACYETFFELNPVLLTVVTDWQMRSIGGTPIVTQVEPPAPFYEAEAYHQDYAARNPHQPYIAYTSTPKVEKLRKHYSDRLKNPRP